MRRSSFYKTVIQKWKLSSADLQPGPMRVIQWQDNMSVLGIDHVQIAMPAGEEEKARAFFINLLGFREIPKPPQLAKLGDLWLEAGTAQLHLGVEANFQPARKAHPAFIVDNLDELITKVQSARLETDVTQPPLDGYKRAHIFDPFGNRIELIEKVE